MTVLRVPPEIFVLEHAKILLVPNFMKIVHVELPHKGREVAVSEVDGQYLGLELLNIYNSEACPMLIPCDYVVEMITLPCRQILEVAWQ